MDIKVVFLLDENVITPCRASTSFRCLALTAAANSGLTDFIGPALAATQKTVLTMLVESQFCHANGVIAKLELTCRAVELCLHVLCLINKFNTFEADTVLRDQCTCDLIFSSWTCSHSQAMRDISMSLIPNLIFSGTHTQRNPTSSNFPQFGCWAGPKPSKSASRRSQSKKRGPKQRRRPARGTQASTASAEGLSSSSHDRALHKSFAILLHRSLRLNGTRHKARVECISLQK